jgi:hypothetical protein
MTARASEMPSVQLKRSVKNSMSSSNWGPKLFMTSPHRPASEAARVFATPISTANAGGGHLTAVVVIRLIAGLPELGQSQELRHQHTPLRGNVAGP